MSTSLRFTVLTPDRVLLGVDSAVKVRVKLADEAWLSVYPSHAPLIAEVLPGLVEYQTEAESGEFSIAGGILQVSDGQVTILTSGYRKALRHDAGAVIADADAEAAAAQQFDRLAKQLLMSLQAQPDVDTAASADGAAAGDAG